MDDELDSLIVRVRADTGAFARDVAAMTGELEGPLAKGAARAGRAMEDAVARFVRTGKLGFDDLRRVALAALSEIARDAMKAGIGSIGGGSGALLGSVLGAVLGAPGRATGGPVTGGRAYVVGERGPELFVPRGDGRIDAMTSRAGRGPVNITVNVAAPRDAAPAFMAKTGDQVARAVRRALLKAEADA